MRISAGRASRGKRSSAYEWSCKQTVPSEEYQLAVPVVEGMTFHISHAFVDYGYRIRLFENRSRGLRN